MNTNETYITKNNKLNNNTFEKMLELKMQIKNEFGIDTVTSSNKSKLTDHVKSIGKNQQEIDIPNKINALFRELNDMEIKSNKESKNIKNDSYVKRDNDMNTKNFNEFKLSVVVRNTLDERNKMKMQNLEEVNRNQVNSNLVRIIKNPKTLISDKTKICMDRLLNNGIGSMENRPLSQFNNHYPV